jgi:hypothetical protein
MVSTPSGQPPLKSKDDKKDCGGSVSMTKANLPARYAGAGDLLPVGRSWAVLLEGLADFADVAGEDKGKLQALKRQSSAARPPTLMSLMLTLDMRQTMRGI